MSFSDAHTKAGLALRLELADVRVSLDGLRHSVLDWGLPEHPVESFLRSVECGRREIEAAQLRARLELFYGDLVERFGALSPALGPAAAPPRPDSPTRATRPRTTSPEAHPAIPSRPRRRSLESTPPLRSRHPTATAGILLRGASTRAPWAKVTLPDSITSTPEPPGSLTPGGSAQRPRVPSTYSKATGRSFCRGSGAWGVAALDEAPEGWVLGADSQVGLVREFTLRLQREGMHSPQTAAGASPMSPGRSSPRSSGKDSDSDGEPLYPRSRTHLTVLCLGCSPQSLLLGAALAHHGHNVSYVVSQEEQIDLEAQGIRLEFSAGTGAPAKNAVVATVPAQRGPALLSMVAGQPNPVSLYTEVEYARQSLGRGGWKPTFDLVVLAVNTWQLKMWLTLLLPHRDLCDFLLSLQEGFVDDPVIWKRLKADAQATHLTLGHALGGAVFYDELRRDPERRSVGAVIVRNFRGVGLGNTLPVVQQRLKPAFLAAMLRPVLFESDLKMKCSRALSRVVLRHVPWVLKITPVAVLEDKAALQMEFNQLKEIFTAMEQTEMEPVDTPAAPMGKISWWARHAPSAEIFALALRWHWPERAFEASPLELKQFSMRVGPGDGQLAYANVQRMILMHGRLNKVRTPLNRALYYSILQIAHTANAVNSSSPDDWNRGFLNLTDLERYVQSPPPLVTLLYVHHALKKLRPLKDMDRAGKRRVNLTVVLNVAFMLSAILSMLCFMVIGLDVSKAPVRV